MSQLTSDCPHVLAFRIKNRETRQVIAVENRCGQFCSHMMEQPISQLELEWQAMKFGTNIGSPSDANSGSPKAK